MKTMKVIWLFLIGLAVTFALSSCGSDSDPEPEPPKPEPPVGEQSDTLDFRVLVYIDEASVTSHLGGSERRVKSEMNLLFNKLNTFFNAGSKELKYTYRYTVADMIVYQGSSQDAAFRKKVYDDPIDFSKYDVTVLFDCLQDNGETGNGGAAHGGGSDNRSVVTVIANPGRKKEIFTDDTYKTLAHELGHYRGVTDMYQYIIGANDNPVSHEAFDAPPCIMRWTSDGVWSEYAVGVMNFTAGAKQIGKEFPGFFDDLYPEKIVINVTVSGKPGTRLGVKLYGSRAGATGRNRDIYSTAFVEGQTDSKGQYVLSNAKKYFRPKENGFTNVPADLPYGRWFGFLAEITSGTSKRYVWMPEYAVQMPHFEGKDTYEVNVVF